MKNTCATGKGPRYTRYLKTTITVYRIIFEDGTIYFVSYPCFMRSVFDGMWVLSEVLFSTTNVKTVNKDCDRQESHYRGSNYFLNHCFNLTRKSVTVVKSDPNIILNVHQPSIGNTKTGSQDKNLTVDDRPVSIHFGHLGLKLDVEEGRTRVGCLSRKMMYYWD